MNEDRDELKELYTLRDTINTRIARLEQRRRFPTSKNGSGNVVVAAEDVRPFIQGWIDQGYELKILAEKADISIETLRKILRLERPTVREATVDKILQALGLPHLYDTLIPEQPEDYHYNEE